MDEIVQAIQQREELKDIPSNGVAPVDGMVNDSGEHADRVHDEVLVECVGGEHFARTCFFQVYF